MKINNKPDYINHRKSITGYDYEDDIGRHPMDASLPRVERFIKNEINASKACSCPHCNYKRTMLRQVQYIINDYKKLNHKCNHHCK